MQRSETSALIELALAAGEQILAVYATDFQASRKADNSPVTEADLRADAVIREGLARAFPGVTVFSEESLPETVTAVETFFLVDPLDGTKEFLSRNGEFTVNIALVSGGRPLAGVVYAPALGELFHGREGEGAWQRAPGGADRELRTTRASANTPLRVIGSRSHGGDEMAHWLAQLRTPHTLVVAGSSLKFCRLAQGQADAYPRLGPTCQWDTAAGQAVLRAAGGIVLSAGGAELRYGTDRPWLNPHFLALGDPSLQSGLPPAG